MHFSYAQNQRDSILVPEALPNKRFYPLIQRFNLTLSTGYNIYLRTPVDAPPVYNGANEEYFFNLKYDRIQKTGYAMGDIDYQVISLNRDNIYPVVTTHAFNKQKRLMDSTFKALNKLDSTLSKKILNLSTEISPSVLFQDENNKYYNAIVNKIIATIQEKYILTPRKSKKNKAH